MQRIKFNDRYEKRINDLINAEFKKIFWDEGKMEILRLEMEKNHKDRLSPYVLSRQLLEI